MRGRLVANHKNQSYEEMHSVAEARTLVFTRRAAGQSSFLVGDGILDQAQVRSSNENLFSITAMTGS